MDAKKKNGLIIIAAILAAAALLMLYRGGGRLGKNEAVIAITVDNREVFRKQSSELELPYTLKIEGYKGGHNVFIIDETEDGTIGIRCSEADCPDKICVETGRVTVPDQPVVCLPHRITARIVKSY